jgi:hypothetical protein
MGRQLGGKSEWQKLVKLVKSGTLHVLASGNDAAVEFDSQDDTQGASLAQAIGHAHYTVSCIVRQPNVRTYILGAGLTGWNFDYQGVYCSVYREYVAGPPPRWISGLRITNLTSADVDVEYQAYKFLGLV